MSFTSHSFGVTTEKNKHKHRTQMLFIPLCLCWFGDYTTEHVLQDCSEHHELRNKYRPAWPWITKLKGTQEEFQITVGSDLELRNPRTPNNGRVIMWADLAVSTTFWERQKKKKNIYTIIRNIARITDVLYNWDPAFFLLQNSSRLNIGVNADRYLSNPAMQYFIVAFDWASRKLYLYQELMSVAICRR